jgi:hypothetical protein
MQTMNVQYDDYELARVILRRARRKALESVYNEIKAGDLGYLDGGNNEFGLYVIYEAFILFMSSEEYEKCALLRKVLEMHFSKKRYHMPVV